MLSTVFLYPNSGEQKQVQSAGDGLFLLHAVGLAERAKRDHDRAQTRPPDRERKRRPGARTRTRVPGLKSMSFSIRISACDNYLATVTVIDHRRRCAILCTIERRMRPMFPRRNVHI